MTNPEPHKLENPQSSDYQKQQLDLFKPKTKNNAQANQGDLGTLIVCALRYCVGRRTYMPSVVIEITKNNWDLLNEKDKQVIARDVREAIKRGNLGDNCDVIEWNDFSKWIDEQLLK